MTVYYRRIVDTCMVEDSEGDDNWETLASIKFSVQDTRKGDVLFAFPTDVRQPVRPTDLAEETGMLLANVSRELRKLRDMELVRPLDPEKHNYKPYVITERGLEIREMIESQEDEQQ